MVITILEARVAQENWAKLVETYQSTAQPLPPPIKQTFLVQDSADPAVWRIITHWSSREELAAYQNSVETPGGVLMFRAAGAEPDLTVFDVQAHFSQPAS
ncbi:MAG: hypothetical protein R6X18_12500 [Chloroflexota bacterium]|jgi:hypothetical protein